MSKMYVVGYIQLYLNTFAGKQWHNAQICNILFWRFWPHTFIEHCHINIISLCINHSVPLYYFYITFTAVYHNTTNVKGKVHPKMKILSLITHPHHVVPNLDDVCSFSEHKWRSFWWNPRNFWPSSNYHFDASKSL